MNAPSLRTGERPGFVGPLGELLLVAVLVAAWLLAWTSVNGSLNELSPGGRALFLVNSFTAETLGLGLIVGLVMVLVLPLRHRSPTACLLVVGAMGIVLQWWYPLLVTASIGARIALGIATVSYTHLTLPTIYSV